MKNHGMKRYALAAGAAALFMLPAACGSSSQPADTGSSTRIVISNSAYSGSLTVKPGQKVTVTNEDAMQHTLSNRRTALFSTGTIEPNGGSETFTAPLKPGSYLFGCLLHPSMNNTLIVSG
jgi:plastocyanin